MGDPGFSPPVPRPERQKKGVGDDRRENTKETCLSWLEMEWVKVSFLIFEVLGVEPEIWFELGRPLCPSL